MAKVEFGLDYDPVLTYETAMDEPFAEILRPLARSLRESHAALGRPMIVGVAGSVAAGKSTFADRLSRALIAEGLRVEILPTDGFLFANEVLAARGLAARKGFPESYDWDALRSAVVAIRRGETVTVPVYSHVTYDIDPALRRTIAPADVVILDGLHLSLIGGKLLDRLIYLDADEAAIEEWFRARLLPLMEEGKSDPKSFYHAFAHFGPDEARAFAGWVWHQINLPNLREHIVADKRAADLVIRKENDHRLGGIGPRG